jgi:hypothetical protein
MYAGALFSTGFKLSRARRRRAGDERAAASTVILGNLRSSLPGWVVHFEKLRLRPKDEDEFSGQTLPRAVQITNLKAAS